MLSRSGAREKQDVSRCYSQGLMERRDDSLTARSVESHILRTVEGDGDLHRFACVPLLARERITEDDQAIHGLAGLNLDVAAERIHAQRRKRRICLKDLNEIGAARSQAAAGLGVGRG